MSSFEDGIQRREVVDVHGGVAGQRLLQAERDQLWQSWLNTLWRQNEVDLGFPAAPAAETLPEES